MTPDADDLCVFAVKRGALIERLDVFYWQPTFRVLDQKLENCSFKVVPLSSLILEKNGVKDGPGGWLINKSEYVDAGIPMLRAVNVLSGLIDTNNLVYITPEKQKALSASEVVPGDLLITMRGTFGRAAVVPPEIPVANMNAALCRIRLKDSSLTDYLMWYLNSTIAYKQFKRHGTKAVQDDLNLGYIKELRVVLPEKEERERVLNTLLSARINSQQKTLLAGLLVSEINSFVASCLGLTLPSHIEHIAGAIKLSNIWEDRTFSVGFYHPERMAAIHAIKSGKHLTVMKLSEIVSFHRDIVNSAESTEQYLGLAGVQSQTGELSGVHEEAAGQAFTYRTGDILYGRLRPYLNKVLLAETSGICSTEFHVMRIKPSADVLPEYLAAIIRSDLILSQTKHMMTGNTHPRISNDDVKNLYIPIPDLPTQKQIVDELGRRRKEARRLKQEAEKEWNEAKAQFEKALLEER